MFNLKSSYFFMLLICSVFIANYLFLDINHDYIKEQISSVSITPKVYSIIKIIVILTQVATTVVSSIIIAYISSFISYYKFDLKIKVSSFFKIAAIVQSIQLVEAIIAKVGENVYQYFSFSLGIAIITMQFYIVYYLTKKLINKRKVSYSILGLYGFLFLLGKTLTLIF